MPAAMQRQFDGGQRVRIVERAQIKADALGKRLSEDRRQRHDQKQAKEQQRDADEQPAHEWRLGRHGR